MTRRLPPLMLAALLAACAAPRPAPPPVADPPPGAWLAPLPHPGNPQSLSDWWAQWQSPLLNDLQQQVQQDNPTLAVASARLAQARAAARLADAQFGPQLGATASASRGVQTALAGLPVASVGQIAAQASWEADLYGQLDAQQQAARRRSAGASAAWHEARVSLAAETAQAFVQLRACLWLADLQRADAASWLVSAGLDQRAAGAGLLAPAAAAQTQASAHEAETRARQQATACAVLRQGLVSLTHWPADRLQSRFEQEKRLFRQSGKDFDATFSVASIPATVLLQRPDLFQAEQEVAAASAELSATEAARYPRLTLNGSIGLIGIRLGATRVEAATWSIGPVALSLPLFTGDRQAAQEALSQARYEEAAATLRQRSRQAVREVEEALLRLDGARRQLASVAASATDLARVAQASQQRHASGLGQRAEVEATQRALLAAQAAQVAQQREVELAWIALYRAAGGGWARPASTPATPALNASPRLSANEPAVTTS